MGEVQLLIRDLLGTHILPLLEAQLNHDLSKELTSMVGYQQECQDRTFHGGGVSIYISPSIKYKRRLDVPTDGLELICI